MCVKEFLGYDCGHCSIPILKQCPLSASNPIFPACTLPAERPIYTKENCHPCSRVVWNMKVLREEEEHRHRHLRGECDCEVVFDGEDREKRVRPRPGKGKGKGKGKVLGGDFGQHAVHAKGEATGMEIILVGETGAALTREEWEPEAQMAAYEYTGFYYGHDHTQLAAPNPTRADPPERYSQGGATMGEGMKWYPGELFTFQASSFSYYPRAASEPAQRKANSSFEADNEFEPEQPAVVSSQVVGHTRP